MTETERLQPLGAGRGAKSQDNPLQTNSPRRNEGLEGKLAKKATCREKFYKSFLPPQLEQKLKSELIRRGQLTRQRKQTECDKTHRRESKTSQKTRTTCPKDVREHHTPEGQHSPNEEFSDSEKQENCRTAINLIKEKREKGALNIAGKTPA